MSLHSFANCLRQFSRLSRFPMSSASVLPRVLSMSPRWYSAHRMPAEDATGSSKRKKVTINTLQSMYRERQPISALTAYDYPGAALADAAGIDIVLCGDSLAMVVLGHEDTSRLTLEEMLMHCRAVARGSKSCFLVGDMPTGTFEVSEEQAVTTAFRLIKEGHVHGVKLEGGAEMAPQISRITRVGIPVMAHIGLTPQRTNSLGGFRVQGKTAVAALKLMADARAVQQAGAFATVLEAIPAEIAGIVTQQLQIPTIGIGAGMRTSGQILVQTDLTGQSPPTARLPKFVKKYGDVWSEGLNALTRYREEVKGGAFPTAEHTYAMDQAEAEEFRQAVAQQKQIMTP